MARGRARQILFRIFYSTSFTTVFFLTIAFACAGLSDIMYQSYRRNRLIDMFLVAGAYVLTGLLASFLFASRLYTNRSMLRDIPKTYIPIDKGELPGKRVWRLVEDCKNRSAVIAYLAKPRSKRIEVEVPYARGRINTLLKPEHSKQYRIFEPRWGPISHPGWSSPAATETPNLEYSTVVAQLTDLIEARAASLAPVDPNAERDEQGIATAEEYVIEALRRPEEVGMRQYISQLVALNVLEDNSLTVAFLTLYERARFAPEPLSEDEFKVLMRMFAEVLRSVKTLDTSRLEPPSDFNSENDLQLVHTHDSLPTFHSTRRTSLARKSPTNASTSSLASSIAGSVRHTSFSHHPLARTQLNPVRSPLLTADYAGTRTASFTTAVPRISNDSVRSVSSEDVYADAENQSANGTDPSWQEPTSRPPFFRNRSSRSNISGSQAQSRSSRHRVTSRNTAANTGRRRSRLRRTLSRRSVESNATGRSTLSVGSARSGGSVIRLNPEFAGSATDLPYEYVPQRVDEIGGPPG